MAEGRGGTGQAGVEAGTRSVCHMLEGAVFSFSVLQGGMEKRTSLAGVKVGLRTVNGNKKNK